MEPAGRIFDRRNPTDQKFTGNPTQSYRSNEPLRVLAWLQGGKATLQMLRGNWGSSRMREGLEGSRLFSADRLISVVIGRSPESSDDAPTRTLAKRRKTRSQRRVKAASRGLRSDRREALAAPSWAASLPKGSNAWQMWRTRIL